MGCERLLSGTAQGHVHPRLYCFQPAKAYRVHVMCIRGKHEDMVRLRAQRGQGHNGCRPSVGTVGSKPLCLGAGGLLGKNGQQTPESKCIWHPGCYVEKRYCMDVYLCTPLEGTKRQNPFNCFASKGDGKLSWVLGFRVPGTGDSWRLLKAIMTAEGVWGRGGGRGDNKLCETPCQVQHRVATGRGAWRLWTGAGRPLAVSQSLSSSSPCIESTVGIRRIYWNCITETVAARVSRPPLLLAHDRLQDEQEAGATLLELQLRVVWLHLCFTGPLAAVLRTNVWAQEMAGFW